MKSNTKQEWKLSEEGLKKKNRSNRTYAVCGNEVVAFHVARVSIVARAPPVYFGVHEDSKLEAYTPGQAILHADS